MSCHYGWGKFCQTGEEHSIPADQLKCVTPAGDCASRSGTGMESWSDTGTQRAALAVKAIIIQIQ